ncbi:hypothetical protein [uncultured Pseudokineococcus sp.]|uniref:hypothetical protein n=1 Tax=uncultured Pseudokineococcus sp. TaxID=1642928 RepID=UPI002629D674|nr:hypothetical protein [uncultured Pseudokineococcus sp.]
MAKGSVTRTIRRWLGIAELDAQGTPVQERASRYRQDLSVSAQLDADLDELRARVATLERERNRQR